MPATPTETTRAEQLVDALAAVRRALRRRASRPAELAALTGAQLELVRLLRRQPGASVAEAAQELRLAPNTVSTLVGRLVEAEVVVRSVDPADRRVARLDLAAPLRRTMTAWRDRRIEAIEDALGALESADRRAIEDALPALTRFADAIGAA